MRLPARILVLGLVILASSKGARTVTPIMVTSTGDSGAGTLRQAILDANGASGADVINFAISGTGVKTITLLSNLPDITDTVTIDGYTQGVATPNTLAIGDNAKLLVVLDGGKQFGGLRFVSGSANSLVRGLVINNIAVVGNTSAIEVQSAGVTIAGNFLGTDPTGTTAVPTGIDVLINGGSTTTVGGTAVADRNLISGTWDFGLAAATGAGVWVLLGGDGTVIEGNYIGTDATGTASLGNTMGVLVSPVGATTIGNVTIGGTATGAGNLISGQVTDFGIKVIGSNTGGIGNVTIQGNIIGLDATGTAALPNGGGGIVNSALGTRGTVLVGGTTAAARNIISGSSSIIKDGIDNLFGANTLVVQGNYIGTDITGTLALGNGGNGIGLFGNGSAMIGGSAAGAGNVISGNSLDGIRIFGGGATIQGNLIGLKAGGASPLTNGVGGISADRTTTTIGGTGAGEGNRIVHAPGFYGIDVENSTGNLLPVTIRGNSITASGAATALGIDLAGDGVTGNDSCDADTGVPNEFQNFPVITSAVVSSGNVTVGGTLNSTANSSFSVDLFSNVSCNPSGNGEGLTYLGSVTVPTDGTCNGSFSTSLPIPAGQTILTATATDSLGNTSEFSACFTATVVATTQTATPTLTATATAPAATATVTPTPTLTPAVGTATPTRTPVVGQAVVVPTLSPGAQAILAFALAILAIAILRRTAL